MSLVEMPHLIIYPGDLQRDISSAAQATPEEWRKMTETWGEEYYEEVRFARGAQEEARYENAKTYWQEISELDKQENIPTQMTRMLIEARLYFKTVIWNLPNEALDTALPAAPEQDATQFAPQE